MSDRQPGNDKGHNSVRFVVVTNQEQMLHALSVRAICFMEEEGFAAQHAFDGNDFQATHMLIYAGDEPVGAIRVRWFNGFAKLERTAIRKKFRDPKLLVAFAEFVFDHIGRKGYDTAITHAKPMHARLWRQLLRFRPVKDKAPVYFEGHAEPIVELIRRIDVPDNAITPLTQAATLFRIEGHWDAASDYEVAKS